MGGGVRRCNYAPASQIRNGGFVSTLHYCLQSLPLKGPCSTADDRCHSFLRPWTHCDRRHRTARRDLLAAADPQLSFVVPLSRLPLKWATSASIVAVEKATVCADGEREKNVLNKPFFYVGSAVRSLYLQQHIHTSRGFSPGEVEHIRHATTRPHYVRW